MSYRPITDTWILARAKLKPYEDGSPRKYYGAYLGGFPERARSILGCSIEEPLLHVCGGMARYYPYAGGFGQWDQTLDLDPNCEPDFVQDARDPFPRYRANDMTLYGVKSKPFKAYLIDPPYSEEDASNYTPGSECYPKPNKLVENAFDALPVGGRVGIIHYMIPRPAGGQKGMKFIFVAGVMCGFNNRMRAYSVFEKK